MVTSRRRRIRFQHLIVVRVLATLIMVIGAAFFAHRHGVQQGIRTERALAGIHADRREAILQQQREIESLRQQVVTLQAGAEIDRAAASSVRLDTAGLQATIVRLQQENVLLKSINDPSIRTRGLALHSFEVVALESDSRSFHYRLIFLQRAQKQSALTGVATVEILGSEDGRARSIPLSELVSGGEQTGRANRLTLDFIYYQLLEGDITLPGNFIPTGVRVRAEVSGARNQRIDRTLKWNLAET